LRDAGLAVELFEYNRALSVCYYVREDVFSSLDAAIQRFPEGIHLIFAASLDNLFDPVRNRLAPALSALQSARAVIVIIPAGDEMEAIGEVRVESLRLVVIPTTQRALRRLAQWLMGDVEATRAHDGFAPEDGSIFPMGRTERLQQETVPGRRYQRDVI